MSALGAESAFWLRWPAPLQRVRDAVLRAAQALATTQSPLREQLGICLRELKIQQKSLSILCYRRARPDFESLMSPETAGTCQFLHSAADYREARLHDVLIKVGPLRSTGWGAAPDAVLSAPRFRVLAQFVWSGCRDEEGFGYDPALPAVGQSAERRHTGRSEGIIRWTTHTSHSGDLTRAHVEIQESDELQVFATTGGRRDASAATLIGLDQNQGIYYPPGARVLSFDPDPDVPEAVAHRTPGETLFEGMYVIVPDVPDIDLGELHADPGRYSRIWRENLRKACLAGRDALVVKLSQEGLALGDLRSRLRDWRREPDSVIHAPQKRDHFRILLQVLGVGERYELTSGQHRVPFWQLAWAEIRRSRGEAIHTGFQEQDILDEQIQRILTSLLPEIRLQAAGRGSFELPIPESGDITGMIRFFRISDITQGCTVPPAQLKVVLSPEKVDQWRD